MVGIPISPMPTDSHFVLIVARKQLIKLVINKTLSQLVTLGKIEAKLKRTCAIELLAIIK